MICGACQQHHETATEVRVCYQRRYGFGEEFGRNQNARPGGLPGNSFGSGRRLLKARISKPEKLRKEKEDVSEEVLDAAEYMLEVGRDWRSREQEKELARDRGEAPLSKPVPAGNRPFRHCPECKDDVLSCPHLPDYWCLECQKFTSRPGIHQNCGPGHWK